MSNKKVDSFKNLRTGKYDWKVPARVLNIWRGYTKTGEAFKTFNMLLIDHKDTCFRSYKCSRSIGDYFTVKDLTAEDKFRLGRKQIQIQLGAETLIKKLEENEFSVEKFWFDFYDLDDLKPLTKQTTYLADVIGIIEEHDPVGKIKNRNGQIQSQIKFNITDGRSVKVTFWDDFAHMFADECKEEIVFPLILIIGSARVQLWQDEVVLSNVPATTIHINCNHYSVTEMRRMLDQRDFSERKLTQRARNFSTAYKVKDLKNLSAEYTECEVLCVVQIDKIQDARQWCHYICTSCYEKLIKVDNEDTCTTCQRFVPFPDFNFEIYAEASDDTGSIIVILEDKEVRNLLQTTALELIANGTKQDTIPELFRVLEKNMYTVKLFISEKNTVQKDHCYIATDIMQGAYNKNNHSEQTSFPHPIQDMNAEPSGSSCLNGSASTYNLASDS